MHSRGFHGFPFKLSSLTVPKKIMGERFCLSEKFSYGKSLWIRRRVSRFSVEMFCPKLPKDIMDKPLCVSEMFWYKNFLDNRGITILSNFFCLTSPKIIVGEPFCVSNLFWYQNVLDNRAITILSIVFVSQCRKFS